jgi:hypothetical protein
MVLEDVIVLEGVPVCVMVFEGVMVLEGVAV